MSKSIPVALLATILARLADRSEPYSEYLLQFLTINWRHSCHIPAMFRTSSPNLAVMLYGCETWTVTRSHTADADATQLSIWVASAVWTHPWAVATQFTISVLLSNWGWWQVTLLEKLSVSIKIHVVKPLYMESVRSVSKLSIESVSSRRELVANSVHTADADVTQLDSWVASVVCIGHKTHGEWPRDIQLLLSRPRAQYLLLC